MRRWYVWAPLGLFVFFLGLAGYQLTQPKDELIRSAMIGKPLPEFSLEPAMPGVEGTRRSDFVGGRPRLLNVWASWCLPCIAEAPHLEELNRRGVKIVGVAIRDKPEHVTDFLAQHGNPYSRIGSDPISAIQFELGSSGVPETYVVDAQGVIRHQHIGDIRAEHVPMLLEKLEEAMQ